MESVSGVNNWKLTVRREAAGVTVLRAVTCDGRAALPEELWGLPVIALGDHALAPNAPAVPGEEVQITCGPLPEEDGWDNHGLKELTLPRYLRRVGDYALLNCDGLERLRLWDDVRFWGGGALMNCRNLHAFHLTRTGEDQGESLAYFADELSRELEVTVVTAAGETARLLFPDFLEVYEENCPAHHFDYNIYGAGYPYHHCFRQKKLSLKDYDGLWRGYLAMEHEADAALRLAFWRVRYPVELSEPAEKAYLAHLRSQAAEAVAWLLAEKDMAGLSFFLKRTEPDRDTLAAACQQAREASAAEAVALLLEEQHRRFPAGMDKSFDL